MYPDYIPAVSKFINSNPLKENTRKYTVKDTDHGISKKKKYVYTSFMGRWRNRKSLLKI